MRVAALAPAMTLVLALPVLAQEPVCDLNGTKPVPEFEMAKAALMKGDYVGSMPASILSEEELETIKTQLPQDGYATCSTIVQRRDDGGFVQEITGFSTDESELVTLYLVAMVVQGEHWVIQSRLFSGADQALELLR